MEGDLKENLLLALTVDSFKVQYSSSKPFVDQYPNVVVGTSRALGIFRCKLLSSQEENIIFRQVKASVC